MKYPNIEPEFLAKFYQVKVNVSDKIVREFRKKFPQTKPKPKPLQVNHDINVINSNGMIPIVMIERPNAADLALAALKHRSMNGKASQKSITKKPKRTNTKPTTKARQTKSKTKPSQKKQKPSRPLFILPKWNKTEQNKKKQIKSI